MGRSIFTVAPFRFRRRVLIMAATTQAAATAKLRISLVTPDPLGPGDAIQGQERGQMTSGIVGTGHGLRTALRQITIPRRRLKRLVGTRPIQVCTILRYK